MQDFCHTVQELSLCLLGNNKQLPFKQNTTDLLQWYHLYIFFQGDNSSHSPRAPEETPSYIQGGEGIILNLSKIRCECFSLTQ